jgi:hypothetical protein
MDRTPLICKEKETGKWFVITEYIKHRNGTTKVVKYYDVTDQMNEILKMEMTQHCQELEKERLSIFQKILNCRDAIVKEDFSEAYHQLYSIADPYFTSFTPWKEIEEAVKDMEEN